MTTPANGFDLRARAVNQAAAYRSAGRPQDALSAVGPLLNQYPGDLEVSWHAALALNDLGRSDEALALARQVVTACPEEPDAWRLLSVLLTQPSEAKEAIAAATRAVQLAPTDPAVRATAGLAYAGSPRLRDRRKALVEAREMLRLAPGVPGLHVVNGEIQLRCNRINQAERAFNEALRLDPGNTNARNGIGLVHDRRGHALRAYRSWANVLGEQPADRDLSHNVVYSVGRWGSMMTVTGVAYAWCAPAFAYYANAKDPHDAQMGVIVLIGMAALLGLVIVSTAVRLLRDRRLARLLWSHHPGRVVIAVVGSISYAVTTVVLVAASPGLAAGVGLVGALVVTVIAIINNVIQRRSREALDR